MRDHPVIDAIAQRLRFQLHRCTVVIRDRVGKNTLIGVVEANKRVADIDHAPKLGMQPLQHVLQIERRGYRAADIAHRIRFAQPALALREQPRVRQRRGGLAGDGGQETQVVFAICVRRDALHRDHAQYIGAQHNRHADVGCDPRRPQLGWRRLKRLNLFDRVQQNRLPFQDHARGQRIGLFGQCHFVVLVILPIDARDREGDLP